MPAGLIPNEGIALQLLELLGAVPVSVLPWQMIFFRNDIVPDADTVLADLVESDWDGYTRLTLDRSKWVAAEASAGCVHATWGTDPVVWQVKGGPAQTPFGFAYVDIGAGVLRFVQRFDAEDITPIVIPGTVSVLPEYTLTSAECEE